MPIPGLRDRGMTPGATRRALEKQGPFTATALDDLGTYREALREALAAGGSGRRPLCSLLYAARRYGLPSTKQLELANKLRGERGLVPVAVRTRDAVQRHRARVKAEERAAFTAREQSRPLKPPGRAL